MEPEIWTPHVTVAAIAERDGRFLIVEEHTSAGLRLNQPAGHLEAGETLAQAVARETLEETAHPFEPEALIGVYVTHYPRAGAASTMRNAVGNTAANQSEAPAGVPAQNATLGRVGATYLRFTFCGRAGEAIAGRALDDGIVRAFWMSADELRACPERHRSPAVMTCIDDYLAGRRVPLDFIHTHSLAPVPPHRAVTL